MNFTILVVHEGFSTTTKDIVGLDLRRKYDIKLFPAKKLASDLAGNK